MKLLLEQIIENVKKYPELPAVTAEPGNMTFRQLYDCALHIAGKLKALGVSKGDFVTIELPRSPEYMAAMLSSWMLGTVFVPEDVQYPEERRDFIASDCAAKARVDAVFMKEAAYSKPLSEDAFAPLSPEDPSVLIYTSGSAGMPKGVLHTQQSVLDSVARGRRVFGLEGDHPGDQCATPVPFSFIAGIGMASIMLCCGGGTCLPPSSVVMDPELFADYIEEHHAVIAYIPPKLLRLFKKKGRGLPGLLQLSRSPRQGLSDDPFPLLLVGVLPAFQCRSPG